jgi:hypothetical protein
VPSPEQGWDYLIEVAGQGMSLGRVAAKRLERSTTELHAIVPRDATPAEISSVRNGTGRRDDPFSGITQRLRRRFPESWVALGLPLAAPGDTMRPAGATIAVCGEEVYLLQAIDAGEDALSTSLRATDPTFGYVFAVLDGVRAGSAERCPTHAIEHSSYIVRGLAAGAYDGEGFILAESE